MGEVTDVDKQCPSWLTGLHPGHVKDLTFLVINLHPGHVKDLSGYVPQR